MEWLEYQQTMYTLILTNGKGFGLGQGKKYSIFYTASWRNSNLGLLKLAFPYLRYLYSF